MAPADELFSAIKLSPMAPARYLLGILLAATGLFFGLGAFGLLVQPDPELPIWQVGVMIVIFSRLPLLGAFGLLWPSLIGTPKACPQCCSGEHQPAAYHDSISGGG